MWETSPLLISLNGICLRKKTVLRFLLINFALNQVLEVNFVQPLLIASEVSCLGIRGHMHSGKQSFCVANSFILILYLIYRLYFLFSFNLAISTSYLRILHHLYKYAVCLMVHNIRQVVGFCYLFVPPTQHTKTLKFLNYTKFLILFSPAPISKRRKIFLFMLSKVFKKL